MTIPLKSAVSYTHLQQVVHRADEPDFDLYKLVPAPTNTPYDAGPYLSLIHISRGAAGIFISKLIPMIRTIISIPAGVIRMNFVKSVSYTHLMGVLA